MATIKLKTTPAGKTTNRVPVRGVSAARKRPTLAEAQSAKAERQAAFERNAAFDKPARGDRPPAPAAPDRHRARPPAQRNDAFRGRPEPSAPVAKSARPRPPAAPPVAPRETAPPPAPVERNDDGTLRLSKRMSELGLCSRREADEWIAKGWVRVDGRVVSELGSRVTPDQKITIDQPAKYNQAQKVTVLMNKPIGYVSGQAEDGYEPAFVLVKPANQWKDDVSGIAFKKEHLRFLAPAGRLDIDSTGLLVLTQDGRVAKRLIGEDREIEKEYLVRVQSLTGERLPDEGLQQLRHGLELDGQPLLPAQVEWLNDDQLRFVLKEGKKRQIRRMCELVGLKVVGLKRVRIGRVMLGDLPVGAWRYLGPSEGF